MKLLGDRSAERVPGITRVPEGRIGLAADGGADGFFAAFASYAFTHALNASLPTLSPCDWHALNAAVGAGGAAPGGALGPPSCFAMH